MAYFECIIGSGSATAIPLIVTCSSRFAGTTITASKTGARTQTQTCPSSSPYEVTFILPEDGTWIISGVVSGQTFSETVTILPYEANLNDIPEGSTVLPTDDIQTWLHCANIWDKNYTSVSQVLSDASTLQALIASNNAADYMARSTTWASDVTADQSAMSYIGLNDYCANTLLDESTWLNVICNSTYFESVLTTKVPTMTSATAPSGTAISSGGETAYPAWKAFDGIDSSVAGVSLGANGWIGYTFTQSVKIRKIRIYDGDTHRLLTFKIQGSNDGFSSDIHDITNVLSMPSSYDCIECFSNDDAYTSYRVYQVTTSHINVAYSTIQFWGRA